MNRKVGRQSGSSLTSPSGPPRRELSHSRRHREVSPIIQTARSASLLVHMELGMSATYNDLVFETSLLARWAAFFDLAGWEWKTGVAPVGDWKPDYLVTFPCTHSECSGSHTILISVLPVNDLTALSGHPALSHAYSVTGAKGVHIADAGALFGANLAATQWEMSHGAGGGIEEASRWASDAHRIWSEAALLVSALV